MSKYQYDGIAQEYSQMLNPTKKYVLIPTFRKLLVGIKNKSILDLACGDGFFTRILTEFEPNSILGIDISNELVKKAIELENKYPLNIKYEVQDVLNLNLPIKFDLVTAVYLLNYAKTEDELLKMCEKVYIHLNMGGFFRTITANPSLKPMNEFEYERRFTNTVNKKNFEDGDEIKLEMREDGKKPFEFINYYWSKETYEKCFKNAGFKSIKWIEPIVSNKGIEKYGDKYWDRFRKNPSAIGIICEK